MITPTENSREEDVQCLVSFWETLGSTVVRLTPEEHDRAMAATSHMPHALAVALAASLPEEFAALTGTGFGDTSRLASGDPDMWQQIFLDNRTHVGESIRAFAEELEQLGGLDRKGLTQPNWKRTSRRQRRNAMLWEVDIYAAEGQPDLIAQQTAGDAADIGPGGRPRRHLSPGLPCPRRSRRRAGRPDRRRTAGRRDVERTVVAPVGDAGPYPSRPAARISSSTCCPSPA